MIAIVSLLLIMGTSLTITRVAAVLLEHTGLSRDSARFQARSAFTGVGFTTSEAEYIVANPVRRKIVMWLMLVGNVGIVSSMSALLLSALDVRENADVGRLVAVLVMGLITLWFLGMSETVDRGARAVVQFAIRRWSKLEAIDYVQLLHLRDDYKVARFALESDHWLVGKTIADAQLIHEGMLVLGIECPLGTFLGTPASDVAFHAGDTVVIYGQAERVAALECRSEATAETEAIEDAIETRKLREQLERSRAGR